MEAKLESDIDPASLDFSLLNDPAIYQKYIEFRKKFVYKNWENFKWVLQSILVLVSLISIFQNELKTRENIAECFFSMFMILLIEVLYQLNYSKVRKFLRIDHLEWLVEYSGQALSIAYWVYFTEIALSNGAVQVYGGMLTMIAIECYCSCSLCVDVITCPIAIVIGHSYSLIRYIMVSGFSEIMLSVYGPTFIWPIIFMTMTVLIFHQSNKKDYLQSETQKYIIAKFRRILNEFPERIVVTQEDKDTIYFSFTNDESIFKSVNTGTLEEQCESIFRRSNDETDILKDTYKFDQLNGCLKSINEFLIDERKTALSYPDFKNESNIIIFYKNLEDNNSNNELPKFKVSKNMRYFTVKTKQIKWDNSLIVHPHVLSKLDLDCFLHIFIDTTNSEQLKAEQTLRKYQRLMLSSVAHEFRNPLNSIKGNLELMEIYNDKKYEKYIKISKNSCLMLNSYVDDILDLGRIEGKAFHLNLSEVDLYSLSKEVYDLFELELKFRKIEFIISIDEPLKNSTINWDKDRLKQVMINLVSNAIKFWKSNIKVEWFHPDNHSNQIEEDKSEQILGNYYKIYSNLDPNSFDDMAQYKAALTIIERRGTDPKNKLFLTVIDDGIGISQSNKSMLFKLFGKIDNNAKLNKKGWGLGLTVCK